MDVGRIPYMIESSMAKLTADEWKNWTCVYSLFVLHDILPKEHLECWWLFVQACMLVCQPILTHERIRIDELLLNFCKTFQRLYGRDACTVAFTCIVICQTACVIMDQPMALGTLVLKDTMAY